jgi:hypothetical protein
MKLNESVAIKAAALPESSSEGRGCPRGFKFNPESRVCDGMLKHNLCDCDWINF